jgi:hypothetical protein
MSGAGRLAKVLWKGEVMEQSAYLLGLPEYERRERIRNGLAEDPTNEFVEAVLSYVKIEVENSVREYAVHCLRFFVVGIPVVCRFLEGLLDDERWTTTEKGLALEGLFEVSSQGTLLRWVLEHPDPEFVETAILNSDPANWGDFRDAVYLDSRIAPLSRVPLGTLARRVEWGLD